jgi:hypothetical protein
MIGYGGRCVTSAKPSSQHSHIALLHSPMLLRAPLLSIHFPSVPPPPLIFPYGGQSMPSLPSKHAPVSATVQSQWNLRDGPVSPNSSAAASGALPTSALASLWCRLSMGPEGGTPTCHSFTRPGQSCTDVCRPAQESLIVRELCHNLT